MRESCSTHRRHLPAVLIVEDEARMRDLLVEVLPEMGYQPVGAKTAEEGMALMHKRSADIVILDLNLPVMDGMAFLARFRERWSHTPVIIMTGFGDLASAQRAIRYGVVDFLTKPCHLGEIEGALGRAQRHLGLPASKSTNAMYSGVPIKPNAGDQDGSVSIRIPTTLTEAEQLLINSALRRHNGNRSAAADELGISRRTLYNRLESLRQHDNDESHNP